MTMTTAILAFAIAIYLFIANELDRGAWDALSLGS
jgi:hypothetical protein